MTREEIRPTKKTTKRFRPTKPCDCAEQMNAQLKEKFGAVLKREVMMNFKTGTTRLSQPLLMVERYDEGKNKLPKVLCSYCPFCGKKY